MPPYSPTDMLRRQGWDESAAALEDDPGWRRADRLDVAEARTVIYRLGRNDGPAILFDLYRSGCIDQTVLSALVPGVWTAAEWPSASLPRRVWIEWFRLGRYPRPTQPTTLYRGTVPQRARGMAWTTDRERAAFFAARWKLMAGRLAYVYEVLASPEAMLADLESVQGNGGRREAEVIVDPTILPRLRRTAA